MRNFVVEEVKMSNSEGHIFSLQVELNQANNHATLALQYYAQIPKYGANEAQALFHTILTLSASPSYAKPIMYLNWERSKMF